MHMHTADSNSCKQALNVVLLCHHVSSDFFKIQVPVNYLGFLSFVLSVHAFCVHGIFINLLFISCRPRWVVPVLPKGELEVLLEAAIDLSKKGNRVHVHLLSVLLCYC